MRTTVHIAQDLNFYMHTTRHTSQHFQISVGYFYAKTLLKGGGQDTIRSERYQSRTAEVSISTAYHGKSGHEEISKCE